MKTKLFLFVSTLFLTGSIVMSQSWQSGTGKLYTSPSNTKVAIGTSSPSEELYVLDNSGYDYLQAVFKSNTASGGIRLVNDINKQWELQSVSSNTFSNPNGFVIFDRSALRYRFAISNDGNVGIGTLSPDAKLEVNGKINCEEIEVKNVGADYVFNDDYDLKSLFEIEQFIKENGHLPGVPPAEETIQGVKLGEFNTLLLEKIEELTLHIIEQDKKIQHLVLSIKQK